MYLVSRKKTFANIKLYIVSLVRLLVIPLIFVAIASLFSMSNTMFICTLCSLAMPIGLNTIVIPSALGRDTTIAAGMILISHLMSCITIPLVFTFIIV